MSSKEIKFHTIDRWSEPRYGLFQIITDSWWLVDDHGAPLFYSKYNRPQCNHNKTIMEHGNNNGFEIKYIPIVYVPYKEECR